MKDERSWNCKVITLEPQTSFPVRKTSQITFNEFTVLLLLTVVRSGVILYTLSFVICTLIARFSLPLHPPPLFCLFLLYFLSFLPQPSLDTLMSPVCFWWVCVKGKETHTHGDREAEKARVWITALFLAHVPHECGACNRWWRVHMLIRSHDCVYSRPSGQIRPWL